MKSTEIKGKEAFLQNVKAQVSERQFKLIEKAVQVLQHNVVWDESLPWGKKRCVVPCIEFFKGIWNWDTAFHCLGISRMDPEFAMEHMETFCSYQLEDGLFPDVIFFIGKVVDTFGKPPVMAWACEVVYRRSKDLEFLKRMYVRLEKNVEFWEKKRTYKGLLHYDAATVNPAEKAIEVRYESGWDNSVRWDAEEPEVFWAIDLNCFMIMTYRSMDYISKELGLADAKWCKKAEELSALVEKELWNESLGCYVDRNYQTNELSDVLTPASFMPLYIGIASKEHARQCAQAAEDHFAYGMPTVAYDHPEYGTDYWRGLTWLNVAYFAAKGLKDYGYIEIAEKIRDTILTWVENDGDQIHENYNSKTGEGCGQALFSWSAVFVMEFLLNF